MSQNLTERFNISDVSTFLLYMREFKTCNEHVCKAWYQPKSHVFFQLLKNFPNPMRKDKYYPLLYKRAQRSRCAFIKVNASSGTRSMSESVREHVGSLLLNIYFFRNLLSLILIYSLASEPNKQRRCILAFSENVDSIAPFISKFAEYANCRIWCMAGADGTHT